MVRDASSRRGKIEACHTSQTLMVRAEAVVITARQSPARPGRLMREKHGGRANVLGLFGGLGGGNAQPAGSSEYRYGEELRTETTYEAYVESRVMQAARSAAPDDRTAVQAWAWLPLTGIAFSVLAVVVMFL